MTSEVDDVTTTKNELDTSVATQISTDHDSFTTDPNIDEMTTLGIKETSHLTTSTTSDAHTTDSYRITTGTSPSTTERHSTSVKDPDNTTMKSTTTESLLSTAGVCSACQQICLSISEKQVECSCEEGFILGPDERSCDAFRVYTEPKQVRKNLGLPVEVTCIVQGNLDPKADVEIKWKYPNHSYVTSDSSVSIRKFYSFDPPYLFSVLRISIDDISISGKYTCEVLYPGGTTVDTSFIEISASEVRLVGGSNRFEGRLEVYYAQQWGTVCDDEFDDIDAGVFCRMLGYGSVGVSLGKMSPKEGGPIWLDDIGCNGQEDHVSECPKSSWGITNCGHTEDVSIRCDQHGDALRYRLVDGPHSAEGKVEVFHESTWKAACMTHVIIERICQQLGYLTGQHLEYSEPEEDTSAVEVVCDDDSLCRVAESECDDISHIRCENVAMATSAPRTTEESESFDVQLVNSDRVDRGLLLVYYGGEWRGVCDDGFGDSEANVFCVMLGFKSGKILLDPTEKYGQGSRVIWMNGVSCYGNESTVQDCSYGEIGFSDCDHNENVYLQCSHQDKGADQIQVRLEDGDFGRLLVWMNDIWGTVCVDDIDERLPQLVCNELGYSEGVTMVMTTSQKTLPWISSIECSSEASLLNECLFGAWQDGECPSGGDVAVNCHKKELSNPVSLIPDDIRLLNGRSLNEGVLQVLHDGTWGTVCDDGFDSSVASLFCQLFGFSSGEALLEPDERFGSGNDVIWMDDVICSPEARDLNECEFNGWGEVDCDHSEDVSVRCLGERVTRESEIETTKSKLTTHEETTAPILTIRTTKSTSTTETESTIAKQTTKSKIETTKSQLTTESEIETTESQLTTGSESESSTNAISSTELHETVAMTSTLTTPLLESKPLLRLVGEEGLFEGQLEIAAGDEWGIVCAEEFGYNEATAVCKYLGAENGQASIVLSASTSSSISFNATTCAEPSLESCSFSQGRCERQSSISLSCHPRVRLVDGALRGFGRLEVFYDGQWGTVCDDGFTNNEAKVFCSALGYRDGSPSRIQYGKSTGPIWMDDVVCKEAGTSLADCEHAPFGTNNCEHIEDISLQCVGYIGYPVRLLDGVFKNEGRVEIFLNLEWGTMCGEGFTDLEANVVCRMLGYGRGISLGNQYGPGWDNIWVDSLRCHGQEETIIACFGLVFGPGTCDHDSDVSVRCLE